MWYLALLEDSIGGVRLPLGEQIAETDVHDDYYYYTHHHHQEEIIV